MKTTISTTQAKKLITDKLSHFFGVAPDVATDEQFYKAVAMIVRDELSKKTAISDIQQKDRTQKKSIIFVWNF